MKKATFLQIVEFINKRDVITRLDLMEQFGYTCSGTGSTLTWLKRHGLVINDRRGEWTITDKGVNWLIYHGRLK